MATAASLFLAILTIACSRFTAAFSSDLAALSADETEAILPFIPALAALDFIAAAFFLAVAAALATFLAADAARLPAFFLATNLPLAIPDFLPTFFTALFLRAIMTSS